MHVYPPLHYTVIANLFLVCALTGSLFAADGATPWTPDALTKLTPPEGTLDLPVLVRHMSGETPKQPLALTVSGLAANVQGDEDLAAQVTNLVARTLVSVRARPSPQEVLSQVNDILVIREWCNSALGYGNLVLTYQCEESALRLLFPLLAHPTPLPELRRVSVRLFSGTPTSEQWLAVLRAEQAPEIVSKADLDGLPEYAKLGLLFQKLLHPDPEWAKGFPLLAGTSELPEAKLYPDCLERPRVPQLVWNVSILALKKSSLDLLLAYMEKAGPLPKEREAFCSSMKKVLGSQLRSRERLGGRMTSGQLWDVYEDGILAPDRK